MMASSHPAPEHEFDEKRRKQLALFLTDLWRVGGCKVRVFHAHIWLTVD